MYWYKQWTLSCNFLNSVISQSFLSASIYFLSMDVFKQLQLKATTVSHNHIKKQMIWTNWLHYLHILVLCTSEHTKHLSSTTDIDVVACFSTFTFIFWNTYNKSCKWPTWRTITLFYSTFITVLYMFRATSCSSSGGQVVLIQHLV